MASLETLSSRYDSLTNKQRSVIDYINSNPESICYITLKDLSRSTGVSEVSILRLCRALGFDGFAELKDAFRERLESMRSRVPLLSARFPRPGARGGDPANALANALRTEAENVETLFETLDAGQVLRCARDLMRADEVFVFGHDGCKILADYMAHRLSYLRVKATPIQMGNGNTVRILLAKLKPGDFVVLFSFPDYHMPVRNIARFAEQRGARVVTITDSMDSPAGTEHGYNFLCRTTTGTYQNSFTTPTMLVVILTSCIAAQLGEETLHEIIEEERSVNQFMNEDLSFLPEL